MAKPMPALEAIRGFHDELTVIRRDLHTNPELGLEEHRTAEIVATKLAEWGIEVHRGIGRTGVVGVLKRGSGGKSIGLRADMDCLPMDEQTNLPYRSSKPGLMHACGHDGHTTMLLGAARYLAASPEFQGTVHFIFQPGEEGVGGALAMLQDGLFERFPCDQVFALHNRPGQPIGTFAIGKGPQSAGGAFFDITITGQGAHGARPEMSVDPVLVAGHIITAVQSIVSRNVKPVDGAVISLCAMQAGDLHAMSVIPGKATLVGTVRTFRAEVQDMVEKRLGELCSAVALGLGATATVHYERIYPATINSPRETEFAADVAESLVGPENVVRNMEPSMGAEDFSFMLQVKPGAYLRIGQGGEGSCMLHMTRYDFNDEILPLGSALHASLVEQGLPLGGHQP
jgi:amidohydrolase